mgnify:FL=1
MKRFLALCLVLTLVLGALPLSMASAENRTMTVVGGWLRLREGANFNAKTLASYYTGTQVTVLGITGKWYRVQAPDGMQGYMYSDYLRASSGGSTSGTVGTTATVVSSNGRGVRLRTGPSTAYGVLRVCPVGTAVTILASGTYWDFIRVDGQTGYMMSQYLSTGTFPVQPAPTEYLARVTSKNGLGVRLRSGAGKGYSVLGVYSVGTEVTVLQHNKTWDYIRVGTRTGYMMNQFLTTSQVVTKVSAVKLNTSSPVSGTVLTAIATPSSATVSYRWTDGNGTLLGTGATYAVSAADVGKRIRVTVTGTGLYSGTATSALTNQVQYGASITGVTLNTYAPVVGQTLTATASPNGATANYWWYRSDNTLVGSSRTYVVQSGDEGMSLMCRVAGTGSFSGEAYSAYTTAVAKGSTPAKPDQPLTGTVQLPSSAKVNDTVYATVSLSTGSVDYTWYLDGWLLSASGSSITVPNNPGSTLTVRVTARAGSGYTGTIESNALTIASSPAPAATLSGKLTIPSTAKAGDVISADMDLNSYNVTFAWYLNNAPVAGGNNASLAITSDMEGGQLVLVASATGTDNVFGSVTSNVCKVEVTPSQTYYTGSVSLPTSAKAGDVVSAVIYGGNTSQVTYDWYADESRVSSGVSQLLVTSSMAGKRITVRVTSMDPSVIGNTLSNTCYVEASAATSSDM